MAEQCQECGAPGRFGSCHELFMTLLALDHERKQPWGRWHTLNVACYLLQHPSQANERVRAAQWSMVQAFIAGGLDLVRSQADRAVRENRHGNRTPVTHEPPPAVARQSDVTIETVSVDGSFPADGYEERMARWVQSIAAGRCPNF